MCVVTGFANHAGTTPDGGLQVWVGASGFRVIQQGAAGLDALCLIGLYESLLNVFPHANNFLRHQGRATPLETQHGRG